MFIKLTFLSRLSRSIIRGYVHPALFFVFNVTFISFIQSILLFLLAAPTYVILLTTQFEPKLTAADVAYTGIELLLILSEWFSDQQQWGMLGSHKPLQLELQVMACMQSPSC